MKINSVLIYGVGLGWKRIHKGTATRKAFESFVNNVGHLGYHYVGVDDVEAHRGLKWNGEDNPPDPSTATDIHLN